MSALRYEPSAPRPGMRRSTQVVLVLLGVAGVAGVAAIWDSLRRDDRDELAEQKRLAELAQQPVEAVNGEKTYSNNQYVPGAGYYHAPFFNWFPLPWNHRDPSRGYFAGGAWHPNPLQPQVQQSRPTAEAVAAAAAAQRRREEEQRARAANFAGSSSGGSANRSTYRPSSTPSPSKPSSTVTRGGFGSSSRSGAS